MTLDPGHFHAALIHREMLPGVSPRIDVYAPLGADLVEHLGRLAAFNARPERPTEWRTEVHAGPDFLERMLRERPGDVVVLAGRSSRKMDYVEAAVEAGLHVLADKPWIIRSSDLPRLEATLAAAEARGLVALDVMTERYEITSVVQRELVGDPAVFGEPLRGSPDDPAVRLRSVHHIVKTVAGAPLRRPSWWFDRRELGEALSDVGTHLVDLSLWTLFPGEGLDHRREVRLLSARGWPTRIDRERFSRVTGEPDFPPSLAPWVEDDRLACACNAEATYSLRGIHVRATVLWESEAEHGDTHHASYRGSVARVEVRQGAEEGWRPETYVVPNHPARREEVLAALRARVAALAERWPGMGVEARGDELRVTIPDRYRQGHEHHFSEVTARFLEYLGDPASVPAWERPNMLAKYYVTTRGTEIGHEQS